VAVHNGMVREAVGDALQDVSVIDLQALGRLDADQLLNLRLVPGVGQLSRRRHEYDCAVTKEACTPVKSAPRAATKHDATPCWAICLLLGKGVAAKSTGRMTSDW
jgi:hypothetical protein